MKSIDSVIASSEDVAGVYRIRFGGKDYVGSSKKVRTRLGWWKSAVKRRGFKYARAQVLLLCSEEHLTYYEERAVLAFRSNTTGWNKTASGHSKNPNNEARMAISKSSKERFEDEHYKKRHTDLSRKRYEEGSNLGLTFSGRTHSEDTKKIMREAKLGKKRPPHVGEAVAKANRLRKRKQLL